MITEKVNIAVENLYESLLRNCWLKFETGSEKEAREIKGIIKGEIWKAIAAVYDIDKDDNE